MIPLDPKAQALLTAIAAAGDQPVQVMTVEKARKLIESGYEKIKQPLQEIGSIEERSVPGPGNDIMLRIYTPFGHGPFPVLMFIHGGGWVLFSPKHYDPICTHLCAGAQCVVVSVYYRRSPETKFPGALNDLTETLQWLKNHAAEIHGDASRIIIAGDSAGANLAAAACLKNRDECGPPLLAQALIYPATDWYDPPTPSFIEFSDGYSLTRDAMVWFWEQYLESKSQVSDPYAVPMKAASLKGLPDALVIVAGYDPLKDEGIRYAEKLSNEGVETTLLKYEDMIHGFMSYLGILDQASLAIQQICGWLKQKYNRV